ncbi:MAG: winged helix-turn-helix transcriptional regulator [Hyphomonas sp.]|uniref:ArsR/SmtB family transcription factor n=1 Tax=Hyphomonas sp. TaxID=87 RepID=UPI0017F9F93B|nr:winged helix-turn-helix domain-containing protein [Hyphomonas sp.]MBU3921896.1 winged helix-turn-helix domain-containing protein [Alphaproteobacteria bacterium]MBA3069594.1 winged helix-turn-helix transcriptional regulator [Hyphomonas sp.]MBU4063245.1 winged helix-turn-helix domain-containing protein [Alphaproteobacteria bacterium]MBU4164063.1 winged helix-turn-helix domain-containing protein [Alphaproteobacteria bacterium]MBU4569292.1 winged helix-turn-helix domain-containing protein [Alph
MKDGPDISRIAALMGDPARSNMLLAMLDGRALTAGELAAQAGITKQTASSHLARLLDGGLVAREVQGRHHYYRLGGADVAQALEALLGVSESRTGPRTRTGPRDPALRKARVCYDHLAGELGVLAFDRLLAAGVLVRRGEAISVSKAGWARLGEIGVAEDGLARSRRPVCKGCLDWSMRRPHLAGQVGAALLVRIFERKWARRVAGSRVISFTPAGEAALRTWLRAPP